jgi:hypothetical protein
MSELDDIIEKYLNFEKDVRVIMDSVCARHCSRCEKPCCNQDYCRETIESPFLSHILEKYPSSTTYDTESGWLTDTGCGLFIGRPPVCYEFLCQDILASQKSEFDRYVVKILSALMTHTGKNAAGGRHIVELLHEDDLHRMRLLRFEKKLQEAQAAFDVVAAYLGKKLFENHSFAILTKIIPIPGDDDDFRDNICSCERTTV